MWYVIHTMSGMEAKCMQQCQKYVDDSDYNEMFVPQYISKKHYKQEWHEVKKTLFPGYMFVDTENIESVMKGLKQVYQYTKVLRDCETISPITEQEQAFLATIMDKEHVVRYSEGFLIGEEVVVTSGPLKDYRGNISKIDRHRRIAKMEVCMFGRMTPMEVGFGAIARVSKEEFDTMLQEQKEKQKLGPDIQGENVRVIKGLFCGVKGKFLRADVDEDEWTVEIDLFGSRTEVMFRREEIEIIDEISDK